MSALYTPPGGGFERGMPANGAFKGRGRHYAALLACPLDGAGLVQRDGALHCTADASHIYPIRDGIARLVPPAQQAEFDARSAAHDEQRTAQGWTAPDEAGFKSLPQTPLPGYPDLYWDRHAAATALLWRFLERLRLHGGGLPVGPAGEAAVIGAGMGWLAYGLDVAGYATVALAAHGGPRFGLGAYPFARYFRVQADPVRPPLARAAFDLLIFQDGLPEGDDRQIALDAALPALRPGGALAVMDALGERDLDALGADLHTAGLRVIDPPQRQGWRGRLAGLGGRFAGRDAEPPPVLFAQLPG